MLFFCSTPKEFRPTQVYCECLLSEWNPCFGLENCYLQRLNKTHKQFRFKTNQHPISKPGDNKWMDL